MEPSKEEIEAFVRRNESYYLTKWQQILDGTGTSAGGNWAALLFTGLWLPYRKLYGVALVFWGIVVVSAWAEMLFYTADLTRISDLIFLIISAICAIFGNKWYYLRATKVISEVRSQGLEDQWLLDAIATRGGTSVVAMIAFPLLSLGLLWFSPEVVELLFWAF